MNKIKINEEITLNTVMHRKISSIYEAIGNIGYYSITKIINLDNEKYKEFINNMLGDYDFIKENQELMFTKIESKKTVDYCLCILNENKPYAILIQSEGYDYARYAAVVPKEALYVEQELICSDCEDKVND